MDFSGQSDKMIRILLNGKRACIPEVRETIEAFRRETPGGMDVRVTWEQGDAQRFVHEARADGVQCVVSAGGDGTLNEVVNGLAALPQEERPELAILPLGTANDFARACAIPLNIRDALHLALHGDSKPVDLVQANDRYFINVASGGFAAEASANLSPQLKNFLGGGAYTLSALIRSLSATHGEGRLRAEGVDLSGTALAGLVCNGRQAGGGQLLAPHAYIDDGWLDVLVILTFPLPEVGQVIRELLDDEKDGRYIKRFRTRWLDSWPSRPRTVNLDGEPYRAEYIRFTLIPKAVRLILPPHCPCVRG